MSTSTDGPRAAGAEEGPQHTAGSGLESGDTTASATTRDDPATGSGPRRAEEPLSAPGRDDGPSMPFREELGSLAVPVNGLLILAVVFTLYAGREFLVPVVAAILLNFLLTPVVRGLRRARVPQTVGAALVVVTFLAVSGAGIYRLAGPAEDWIRSAPVTLAEARSRLAGFYRSVEQVRDVVDEIGSPDDEPNRVQILESRLSDRLVERLRVWTVGGVAALFLLFFLLASGDRSLRKAAGMLPGFYERRRLVEIARRIERDLSRYLITTTVINIVLGTAVGLALWRLGLPNPTLWGVVVAFLNFIPYVGAVAGVILISLVSLVTFESPGAAAAPPLAYLALNTLEAYLFTPAVMGRRFSLDPVIVFVSVIFWGWIWGVAGALMAVPLLTMAGIVCNRIERLSPVARLLER